MSSCFVEVKGLSKEYGGIADTGRDGLVLFRDLTFCVKRGEMLAISGESGAGKSTLLHLLAAMDRPTAGTIVVDGADLRTLQARQQAEFRNRVIGYVWQAHYLLPEFTAAENVAMPLLAHGEAASRARKRALRWLDEVGLAHRAEHRAGELSGGEQQRVSLARALVTEPKLLLADEPTGNLDAKTAELVFALLQRLHREHGTTTVLVTHNLAFASRCDVALRLSEGHLVPESGKS